MGSTDTGLDNDVIDVEHEEVERDNEGGPGFPANVNTEGEPMGREVALRQSQEVAVQNTMTLAELVAHVQLIQGAMREVMKDGTHYGVIPGTDKPTLYKAGAETLLLLFRLAPEYIIQREWSGDDDQHLTVWVTCRLTHVPSGDFVGSGEGSCSTLESKYATRQKKRKCPSCGAEAIIKGKTEYGGGWVCWKKAKPVGGCGTAFPDGSEVIESQEEGTIENPDLPDVFNTVVKIGCKRALVAGVLNVTAASDIFTQDMEDSPEARVEPGTQPVDASQRPQEAQPAQEQAKPADDPAAHERGVAAVRKGIALLDGKRGWSEPELLAAASASFQHAVDSIEAMTVRELGEVYRGMMKHGGLPEEAWA